VVGVSERERVGRIWIVSGLRRQMSGRGPKRREVELASSSPRQQTKAGRPFGLRLRRSGSGGVHPSLSASVSPDLNPIEMSFSKFKSHLRTIAARTVPASPASNSILHAASPPLRMLHYFQACRICFHMTGIRCSDLSRLRRVSGIGRPRSVFETSGISPSRAAHQRDGANFCRPSFRRRCLTSWLTDRTAW
jgi:hypothetical protein